MDPPVVYVLLDAIEVLPRELTGKDIAGLEIHAKAQRSIVLSLSHAGVPSPYLQHMVARGDLGVRSGKGFYDWTGRDATEVQRQANERLQRLIAFLEDGGER